MTSDWRLGKRRIIAMKWNLIRIVCETHLVDYDTSPLMGYRKLTLMEYMDQYFLFL